MNWYKGYSPQQRYASLETIHKAIADGVIKDAYDCKCEICGQDKGVREWHADDYAPETLLQNIRVLCWKCHRNLHIYEIGPKHEKYEWAKRYFEKVREGVQYTPTYTRFYTKEMEDAGERPSYKQN